MNYPNPRLALAIVSLLLASCLQTTEVNLSGGWVGQNSYNENATVTATLVQEGRKVSGVTRDPSFIAFFGEHFFIATVDGTSLRGKIATGLPVNLKDFCGKNWGQWVEFELELSSDGNRLEGRWKQFTSNTKEAGCPLTNEEWKPYVLTRTGPALPASPRYLVGALSLLGLALVFFFIRSAFENYLVGSLKRSPNTAGLAGWALFGGLLLGSAIGSVALVGSSYMVLPVLIPLALLSLLCFVMCAVFSGKK